MREIFNQIHDYFDEFKIDTFDIEERKIRTHSLTVRWEQNYIVCTKVFFPNSKNIWSEMIDQFNMTSQLISLKNGY